MISNIILWGNKMSGYFKQNIARATQQMSQWLHQRRYLVNSW